MKRYYFLFLCFSACSSSSVEDFRCEGETQIRALTIELRQIHSRDELRAAIPRVRKKILKLSELLIDVREFLSTHLDVDPSPSHSLAGDELFAELARLYEMPGGKELMETAQIEAIDRLKGTDRAAR